MRRPLVVLAAAALVLGAAGCSSPSGAGDRVSPAAPSTPVPGGGSAEPAPADLVAAADLVDCPASDPDVPARSDGLPDLTLPCLGDGPGVRLAGLRGTPTVLNLWASWCEPCRDELPLLADLSAAAGPSLRVLGVDVQDSPSSALSLLADTDVHYASVRDDDTLTKAPLRWTGLPMTVFVDADGVVTHVQRGTITSDEQLRGLVQEHLGVTVPA
ncbi:MAG: TlpA disulfide reductase family protein [Candidatus Nanopelagicales bacterium]